MRKRFVAFQDFSSRAKYFGFQAHQTIADKDVVGLWDKMPECNSLQNTLAFFAI